MTEVEPVTSIEAIVARAEEFMRDGLINASRCGPAPKREGIRPNRGKGRAFEWLCKHVSYDEKKCLFWPFSKEGGHPSLVGYCGKVFKPVRLMCLLAHGVPPSERHQACHTCGSGNKGCINPQHLVWKTPSEARCDEYRSGQRKAYGKAGKLTPTEAAEMRALAGTRHVSEIAKMYGLSAHRTSEILRGKSYKPMQFSPSTRNGIFYPRLTVARRSYSLGGYASISLALAAYEAARKRARLGEPILPSAETKPTADDLKRWYQAPSQQIKFGDREGEVVTAIEPDQEQSMFIMHRALNDLHPIVRKFLLAASDTGDLAEAAEAAGLNQTQVTMLLPRLRAFLRPEVR